MIWLGSILIGVLTAIMGYPVFDKGINYKNLFIIAIFEFLWYMICSFKK